MTSAPLETPPTDFEQLVRRVLQREGAKYAGLVRLNDSPVTAGMRYLFFNTNSGGLQFRFELTSKRASWSLLNVQWQDERPEWHLIGPEEETEEFVEQKVREALVRLGLWREPDGN
jgi:hypothetical protein